MILKQSQEQKLSQWQVLRMNLLQMSYLELGNYLQQLEETNPLVEREEAYGGTSEKMSDHLLAQLQWLEENDYQNRYYQPTEEERTDPMFRLGDDGGLEDTLLRFLTRQIQQLRLEKQQEKLLLFLSANLDDDGYLRQDLESLSSLLRTPQSQLEASLEILQSLEPAGVGARNLAECLTIQLERLGHHGPPVMLVQTCLEQLAKHQYRSVAQKLNASVEDVHRWEALIQSLDPRPGAAFHRNVGAQYVQPDVLVEEGETGLLVRLARGDRAPFQINAFYRGLLESSEDPELRRYLTEKLQQAQQVLQAVEQRNSTLLRCVQSIAARQEAFFRLGPQALKPMKMAEVALELGVHESTVSRAVREKYLQCSSGIYPVSFLFSRGVAAAEGESVSTEVIKQRLKALIDAEDRAKPLSDQKLCDLLAREGHVLSRRTVAKYREQMQIPGTSGRKKV